MPSTLTLWVTPTENPLGVQVKAATDTILPFVGQTMCELHKMKSI